MRPSSRCGICSCHLFCGGGLSWCHSYCLLKDCFRPLPAGPFHWGVIPCIWWLVSGLSDAKLWLAKETWTIMVEPELQLTRTMAFFFFLSLPGFMTANEHIQSKAVQLEGFPLPFDSSKAFPQAAGAQWNIFPLYTLYAWLRPSILGECHCGNLCGVWFCEPFHWW